MILMWLDEVMREMKYIYSQDKIPKGFKYPELFLKEIDLNNNLYPWIFIDVDSDAGELLHTIAMSDGKNLVPFASLENGDGDAACFDGNDCSGNPAVIMLILDDSGRSYSFKDFSEWLKKAKSDAAA